CRRPAAARHDPDLPAISATRPDGRAGLSGGDLSGADVSRAAALSAGPRAGCAAHDHARSGRAVGGRPRTLSAVISRAARLWRPARNHSRPAASADPERAARAFARARAEFADPPPPP